MSSYIENIRTIAEKWLANGDVELVIGFRAGSLPMMNEPCMIQTSAGTSQLVWDSNCGVNLANYITGRTEKIGIVAKGCDSRNIVNHIVENKIKREQLKIIGVPCQGMIDRRKITEMAPGEIRKVREDGESVFIKGADFEETLVKAEVLQQNCSVCTHRNPVIYDELAGELVAEQEGVDRYADVAVIEALSEDEKWDYFENLLAPCVRCYACRNACPLCYCPTCFVDESKPQWVGKSQDPVDVRTFHFLRAYHCAGRCTDCGACERVCPVGINMRVFTKKLEKDCFDAFGWEAGLDPDVRPPLDTYRPGDPDAFIK